MKDFEKGLLRIGASNVVPDEYVFEMYSKDYEQQLMLFANLKDLKELRDWIDQLVVEREAN